MMMTECETTDVVKTARPRVGQPCEDDSIDAADYQKKFIEAVQQARDSIRKGNFITLEELEKKYHSWTFGSYQRHFISSK